MNAVGTWPAGRPLVEVRSLSCGHRLGRPDEVIVLQGIDLELTPGEVIALIGPGGSGKTTLLRTLAGLEPPAAGRVLVGGLDLARSTAAERDEYRRTLVGYVAQEPESVLWPELTALENVEAPMLLTGMRRTQRGDRARQLLDALRLTGRRRPPELAGGDRLRLALAVALANHPSLLLVDDPTGEVDRDTAHEVLSDLEALLRTLGAAAVVASRSQDAARYVDRLMWLGSAFAPQLVGGAYRDA